MGAKLGKAEISARQAPEDDARDQEAGNYEKTSTLMNPVGNPDGNA